MTDWPRVILSLRNRGLRLEEIAKRCRVNYTTIARLELGTHKEPRYSLGQCLLNLMAETQERERV